MFTYEKQFCLIELVVLFRFKRLYLVEKRFFWWWMGYSSIVSVQIQQPSLVPVTMLKLTSICYLFSNAMPDSYSKQSPNKKSTEKSSSNCFFLVCLSILNSIKSSKCTKIHDMFNPINFRYGDKRGFICSYICMSISIGANGRFSEKRSNSIKILSLTYR